MQCCTRTSSAPSHYLPILRRSGNEPAFRLGCVFGGRSHYLPILRRSGKLSQPEGIEGGVDLSHYLPILRRSGKTSPRTTSGAGSPLSLPADPEEEWQGDDAVLLGQWREGPLTTCRS